MLGLKGDLQGPADEANVVLELHARFLARIREENMAALYKEVEVPLVGILADLEFNGILLDKAELISQSRSVAGLARLLELA